MGEAWPEARLKDLRGSVDPEVYKVVEHFVKKVGWRLRKQGHSYAIYCPCAGEMGDFVTVPGTSKNPGNAAKRVKRSALKCPDRHELIK